MEKITDEYVANITKNWNSFKNIFKLINQVN